MSEQYRITAVYPDECTGHRTKEWRPVGKGNAGRLARAIAERAFSINVEKLEHGVLVPCDVHELFVG